MPSWEVGDLALCLKMSGFLRHPSVEPGRIFKVEAVEFSEGTLGIILEGAHSRHRSRAHVASSFRKILPDKHEACEEEFVTLLRKSKVSA